MAQEEERTERDPNAPGEEENRNLVKTPELDEAWFNFQVKQFFYVNILIIKINDHGVLGFWGLMT